MIYNNSWQKSTMERFMTMLGEILMYYQCIEHDMRRIYSGMSSNDYYDSMDMLDGKNWGSILIELESLDYSDNNPYFTVEEYKQLNKMREQRNYWCHQCFLDLVYIQNDVERYVKLDKLYRRLENEKDKAYKLHKKMQEIYLEDFCE